MHKQSRMMKRLAMALLVGLLGVLTLTSIVAHASPLSRPLADPPWGPGVRVSDDEKSAQQDYPATAVASTGDVYAVWADYRDYFEVAVVYFARSTDGGQTWSANVPVTTGLSVHNDGLPAVAAAGPRDVHVVWGSSPLGYQHVYYSRSADSGQTWGAPQRLDGSDPTATAIEPDVATDGADNVYVVWSQYSSLNLARSADGGATWPTTPTQVLTTTQTARNPALAVDVTGTLHLVWEEASLIGAESVICYARSADHGASWTPRHCFGKPDAFNQQTHPDIAVSPLDGRIHIVWREESGNTIAIHHTTAANSGDGWSTPRRISDDAAFATWPAVAVNATGNVCVVWEQGAEFPEIYYARSTDGGQVWSTPGRVNDSRRGFSHRHPAIAAGYMPHVLWAGFDAQGVSDIYATALTPPRPVTIPLASDTRVAQDGQCDEKSEYWGALKVHFPDFGMTGTVYLQHDATYLYVCMEAHHGFYDRDRAAVVYLDTDGARETQAEADDYALKVSFVEGTMGRQSSFFGSGNPTNPYSPTRLLLGWTGVATYTGVVGQAGADLAEYRIPITLTGGLCGAPFGLAVYHQGYQGPNFVPYGWPGNQFYDEPHTWQMAYYAGEPCPTPAELPVFGLLPPDVTPDDALDLAGRMDGITGTEVITGDTHAGTGRLLVVDEGHGTQFEMFGASGGFLASNPARAFGAGQPMNPNAGDPSRLACQFLLLNGLFTGQTPGHAQNCDNPAALGYEIILIKQTQVISPALQQVALAQAQAETIGVVVKVPVGVEIPTFEAPPPVRGPHRPLINPQPEPPVWSVPFDGPGGHLTLLFLSTDPESGAPSLDSSVPGLGAVAAPSFGRRLQSLGTFKALSRAEVAQRALQHVRQTMPQATNVQLGEGELVYYLGDPAVPQTVVLPMWAFHNVSVTLGSETAVARGFYIPAVDGVAPVVTITAPLNGAFFHSGDLVTVTAVISGGVPPYTYTLTRDDGAVLRTGSTGGSLQLPGVLLTATLRAGGSVSVTLRLDVTDQNGVSGWATVSLQPIIYQVYLPLVLRNFGGGSMAAAFVQPTAPQAINYDVGVEYVGDYPPLGPGGRDIPMTVPDANGFYNQLRGYGWGHAFKYGETLAWEKDWRDCSLGGIDCTFGVEKAEFAYFAGHGSPARIYFSSNKDSNSFWGGNARFQNTRWAGFASCQTLRATTIGDWFNAFQGTHMLLGFHSNMADIAFGGPLGYNMREHCFLWWCSQLTIREAWVKTAFDMNAGLPAYIYAVGTNGYNPVNNKLPEGNDALMSRPSPVASWHWVWWE